MATPVLTLGACGVDVVGFASPFEADGAPPGSVPSNEAGTPVEAGTDAPTPAPADGGLDAPAPTCSEAACETLDSKWKPFLVAIGSAPATCPSGDALVLRTEPSATPGACACRATNTVSPSCTNGDVAFRVGTNCNGTGVVTNVSSSACEGVSGSVASSLTFAPLAATGGSCSGESVTDASKVTSNALTMCAPSCAGDVCAKRAPVGFRACVVANGDIDCDAPGFTERHEAGQTTLGCGGCSGCTASAACNDVTIDLYSNSGCTNRVYTVQPNNCASTGGASGDSVAAMIYRVTTVPTYTVTGPPAATVGLDQIRTVCCAP